jgi:uncharacterized protein (DUF1015 family)
MLCIKPFCALRPRQEFCAQVASVPYDVVDRQEALALAHGNPLSFLHISRSEIDLPETTDPYSAEVYTKAATNFALLQERGILVRDPHPSIYVYRLKRNSRYQHGIVACCHAADYENNIIKKHEKTRIDKETDRKKHTIALQAHSGPVFLIYRDKPDIDNLIREAEQQVPLYDFTAPDGIGHTVWPVPETESLIAAFRQIPAAYIADGHHRAAAAVSVARELRQARPADDQNAEYNWFLTVLFPASQLEILPYNRCVRDLAGLTASDFLAAVKTCFVVEENARSLPSQPGKISMYLDSSWFELSCRKSLPANDPVASLDVSILQAEVFDRILGIKDPRTDKRLEFIGGIHGPKELERRVNSGAAAVAFSMYPVTVDQLLAIADAGQIMPPKSTWFEPKLRDALLIHMF